MKYYTCRIISIYSHFLAELFSVKGSKGASPMRNRTRYPLVGSTECGSTNNI